MAADLAAPKPSRMPTQRIPNLLHLLLLLALTLFSLLFSEALILALHHDRPMLDTLADARLQIFASVLTYLLTLGACFAVFRPLWHRSFLEGVAWNAPAVKPLFAVGGLVLGFMVQGGSTLLPNPKNEIPVEALFHNPALIWLLVAFGTLLAPLFEEIVFRGFLLPGIAIVADYMALPRDLDAVTAWRASDAFSTRAWTISALITSVLFAGIHAPQLGYTWPAVALLVGVSLVLCLVRIRTRSVAASTLVHAFYNLSVFLTLFVSTGGFRHLDRG